MVAKQWRCQADRQCTKGHKLLIKTGWWMGDIVVDLDWSPNKHLI